MRLARARNKLVNRIKTRTMSTPTARGQKLKKHRFVFLQLPISKHREYKQQRTPKLVVDYLRRKNEENTSSFTPLPFR